LILLVNANLSEHRYIPDGGAANGKFHDYMPEWYVKVGYTIVQTMIINAILPFSTLGTSIVVPKLKRWLDNGFSGDPYKTKKTGM